MPFDLEMQSFRRWRTGNSSFHRLTLHFYYIFVVVVEDAMIAATMKRPTLSLLLSSGTNHQLVRLRLPCLLARILHNLGICRKAVPGLFFS